MIVMSIGIWYFYPKFLSELGQKTSNSTQNLVKYWYFFGIIKYVLNLISVVAISLVLVWFRFVIFLRMTSS